jgi:hypothetical protein
VVERARKDSWSAEQRGGTERLIELHLEQQLELFKSKSVPKAKGAVADFMAS